MADWRFQLLTLPGRVWVDRDLPLQGAQVITALSGAASISGRLPLGYRGVETPDGKRALVEWGAGIVAEQEGRDPVFGIVDELSTDGDWLTVNAGGFTSYPTGMPWTGDQFSSVSVDPLDVVRLIWDRLQSYDGGNLGVVVDATKSEVRLGKPEDAKLTEAKQALDKAKTRLGDAQYYAEEDAQVIQYTTDQTLKAAGLSSGGLVIRSTGEPKGDKRSKRNLWLKGNADGLTAGYTWNGKRWVELSAAKFNAASNHYLSIDAQKAALAKSKEVLKQRKTEHSDAKSKVSDLRDGEAEPYTLSWWENHDLGSVITDLAKETPFEYREHTAWDGEDALKHRLVLGCPEFGARR